MFTFDIASVCVGWLRVVVGDGHEEHHLSASYLTDALDDLLDALVGLTAGYRRARVSWDREPAEYRWLFDVDRQRRVYVQILSFRDRFVREPDIGGQILIETQMSLRELVRSVVGGSRALLNRIGEDGYAREWSSGPFPMRDLLALERWLAES